MFQTLVPKWKKIAHASGIPPYPKYGHRAVAVRDLMLVFGGDNGSITDELHTYHISTNQWSMPDVRGNPPPRVAASALTTDGDRVYLFGGLLQNGTYSNELYELKVSNWEWRKVRPTTAHNIEPPKPRLGHSFTLVDNRIFLFGGLFKENDIKTYLNDLYVLDLDMPNYQWDKPTSLGPMPSPRESHTAVTFEKGSESQLLIYGGMNGEKLGDIWILNVKTLTWKSIKPDGYQPIPRSLHTANIINNKMIIFGGWITIPKRKITISAQKYDWKGTNNYAILDLNSMKWEYSSTDENEINGPKARAGHSAIAMNARLYIWAGLDGDAKAIPSEVRLRDMWFLETRLPSLPFNISITRTTATYFEVMWDESANADCYYIQIKKVSESNAPTRRITASNSPVASTSNSTRFNIQQSDDSSDSEENTNEYLKTLNWIQSPLSVGISCPKINLDEKIKFDTWYDIGVFGANVCSFGKFFVPHSENDDYTSVLLPTYINHIKYNLEYPRSYRLRIAALNVLGRGPWSNEVRFKTKIPYYPPSPISIKLQMEPEGVFISWEMPQNYPENCHEYRVYLGVLNSTTFKKVYCGPLKEALIGFDVLKSAYIGKMFPIIKFRIAARNDRGFSRATQVSWKLDSQILSSHFGIKRSLEESSENETTLKKK